MSTEKLFKFLYIIIALTYVSGLFMPLMENDSAQHAVMAMRIYHTDNFFELYRGNDVYLDKPHLHFWLAALSYKLFGISEWAYRLPSLIFSLIGAFSVFNLTREIYKNRTLGHMAVLIFISSQTIFLANHDVRTDAVLTGATIFSIWQFYRYISNQNISAILLGSIGLGVSFSTKGLYGPMIVFCAIFSQILFVKKLSILISLKTLMGVLVLGVSISPVIYSYYDQFGVEGIKFILWNQSIERANATNLIPNNTDYFFFFHSIVWLFFPWSLVLYYRLINGSYKWVKNSFKPFKTELVFAIFGVLIPLLILSFSQFKLPHYVNPLIPLLSIITAQTIYQWNENQQSKTLKVFLKINYALIPILIIGIGMLLFYVFQPAATFIQLLTVLVVLGILAWSIFSKHTLQIKLILVCVLMMVFINSVLNLYFYPNLLKYQAGLQLSKLIKEKNINPETIFMMDEGYSWTLDFYTKRNTPAIDSNQLKNSKDSWVFVDKEESFNKLKELQVQFTDTIEVQHFRVSKLNLKFINPSTRESKLKTSYLLKLKP